MTLYHFATRYAVWERIAQAAVSLVDEADLLLKQIGDIPVLASAATRTLGSYHSRGAQPRCIRIQLAQEPDNLIHTLLHEVAHLCDHLVTFQGRAYRGGHGSGWRRWALALNISPSRHGHSPAVAALHQQRLKIVAVCERCSEPIYRVRRLPRRQRYRHKQCGGLLRPVE